MLWNRFDELAGDVRGGIRRRFHALVDHAGLDERRARDWVVVRMLNNAAWRLLDDSGTEPVTSDEDFMTTCIAIAKAVQD
jgi:streptomycin 6-kinase